MTDSLRLYSYWRSSSSWRVRIALALKGLSWEQRDVHLLRDGGEQRQADYHSRNPQELVPLLEHGGVRIAQSMAICEYLDTLRPSPRLVPEDAVAAAQVRALTQTIACEVQPLNNLRVLNYLRDDCGLGDEARKGWYQHWVAMGFAALEEQLRPSQTPFAAGSAPSLFEVCLIPQMYNARRFDCPLEPYPQLLSIEAECLALNAFSSTSPELQTEAGT